MVVVQLPGALSARVQDFYAVSVQARLCARVGETSLIRAIVSFDFPEPRVRINTDPADAMAPQWNEREAWDQLAEYYRAACSKSAAAS